MATKSRSLKLFDKLDNHPVIEYLRNFRHNIKENPTPLYIAIAIVAALIGGGVYGGIYLSNMDNDLRAQIEPAFISFINSMQSTNTSERYQGLQYSQSQIETFKVKHPRSKWTIYFDLMKAVILDETGNYTEAQTAFEHFARTYKNSSIGSVFVPRAEMNAASCIMDSGDLSSAIAKYRQVIAEYPTGDIVPEAYYNIAVCYERLGQFQPADEALTTIISNYPESGWVSESRRQRTLLRYRAAQNRLVVEQSAPAAATPQIPTFNFN